MVQPLLLALCECRAAGGRAAQQSVCDLVARTHTRRARGRMAVPAPRLCLLLSLLLSLLCTANCAQQLPINGVNGFSLHPPYFNLAEGTKISATSTCGEAEESRPVEDLYCKLVGGPVLGDPSQTIQVLYAGTRGVKAGLGAWRGGGVHCVPRLLLLEHCYFVHNLADVSLSQQHRNMQEDGWRSLCGQIPPDGQTIASREPPRHSQWYSPPIWPLVTSSSSKCDFHHSSGSIHHCH